MKSSHLSVLAPPVGRIAAPIALAALLSACASGPDVARAVEPELTTLAQDCPPYDPRFRNRSAQPRRVERRYAEPVPAVATLGGGWYGPRLSLSLGQRSLDRDYAPVEDQLALGIGFHQQVPDSALGWELGLIGSIDEDPVVGGDLIGSTLEFYGGVRATLARGDSPVRPYIGAGGALINAYYDDVIGDDHDSSPAVYAHAGVEIEVSPVLAVGLDLRGLFGSDIELFGIETDADYTQLTAFISLIL